MSDEERCGRALAEAQRGVQVQEAVVQTLIEHEVDESLIERERRILQALAGDVRDAVDGYARALLVR